MTIIRHEVVKMKQEVIKAKGQYLKMNTNLDRIYRLLSNTKFTEAAFSGMKAPTKINSLEDLNFPLSTSDEISQLDQEIRANSKLKSQLIQFLSKISGTSGEHDSGKVVYKVVDYVFDSDVLINYSWTGVSRASGSSAGKKSFQNLEGILGVFFEVLSLADCRHTVQKNVNIFKDCVLKHAKKRSLRKRSKCGETNTNQNSERGEASSPTENLISEPNFLHVDCQ